MRSPNKRLRFVGKSVTRERALEGLYPSTWAEDAAAFDGEFGRPYEESSLESDGQSHVTNSSIGRKRRTSAPQTDRDLGLHVPIQMLQAGLRERQSAEIRQSAKPDKSTASARTGGQKA